MMARRIVLTMLLLVGALLVTAVAPLGLLIAGPAWRPAGGIYRFRDGS